MLVDAPVYINLELGDLLFIDVGADLRITGPVSDELMNWCESELTVDNPEYTKKLRMGFWVGKTPKKLAFYEVIGDKLVLPYGCLDLFPGNLRQPMFFIPSRSPNGKVIKIIKDVPLYDYQKVAVDEMLKSDCGILESPAGSGKTQMGIAMIQRLGLKALWITHTLDLVSQSKKRASQYIDKSQIGEISGGKVHIGSGVTFATVQTLSKVDLEKYSNEWDVVIVDECHRAAGTPTSITQFYKVLSKINARYKYGLSATVHRSDGLILATHCLLGAVKYQVTREEVASKIIPVGVVPVYTDFEPPRTAYDTDGTIQFQNLISSLCESDERDELILKCLRDNKDKSCLILSDRIFHLENIINKLPSSMRDKAVLISGESKKEDRNVILEKMRTGEKRYLFATYSLAKEGLDIPRLERLFLVTPKSDYAVITQSIGRIARQFEGKSDALVYDFIDDSHYLNRLYKKRITTYKKNECYWP